MLDFNLIFLYQIVQLRLKNESQSEIHKGETFFQIPDRKSKKRNRIRGNRDKSASIRYKFIIEVFLIQDKLHLNTHECQRVNPLLPVFLACCLTGIIGILC